jgi:hypothetical protein
MYNRRSHSPNTSSPTAVLLAGFGLRPKRKAPAHNGAKGPARKAPRQDDENSKSDDDMRRISRFEDEESCRFDEDNDDEEPNVEVQGSEVGRPLDNRGGSVDKTAGNEDPDSAEETTQRSDVGDRDGPEAVNNREKFRSTTTIATRGRIADTNSGLRLALAATVSKVHQPFIPFNLKAIRQGFLEGGVKLTDGTSTTSKSTSNSI